MSKLDETIERPRRYWIEDGVIEFGLGLLSFFTGAIFWFGQRLDRGSTFTDVYTIAAPCLCGVIWVASVWLMKKLKERIVVPRAGYVAVRESAKLIRYTSQGARINLSSKLLPLASVVFLGAWALIEARDELWLKDPSRWGWIIRLSLAVWLAVCLAWTALQFKAPRYLWLVLLALAVGLWTYAKSSDPTADLMMMLTWLGGASAVMGAWRFRNFLIANPRIEDGRE
jgi:hypothetical protein